MIVVAFEPRDALAIALPAATDDRLEAAVELGHRIGNQHWDLAVEDGVVYVPLEADRHIVERVVADVVPGSELRETTVKADLFVTDVDADAHGHGGDSEHGHARAIDHHDHGHADHSHDHAGGHEHDQTDHEHDHHDY